VAPHCIRSYTAGSHVAIYEVNLKKRLLAVTNNGTLCALVERDEAFVSFAQTSPGFSQGQSEFCLPRTPSWPLENA